jgi:5-bromo-4-chloroindolyl phosphate hydrolysis protein
MSEFVSDSNVWIIVTSVFIGIISLIIIILSMSMIADMVQQYNKEHGCLH